MTQGGGQGQRLALVLSLITPRSYGQHNTAGFKTGDEVLIQRSCVDAARDRCGERPAGL